MLRQQRLSKELQKIAQAPPKGICLYSKDDKYNVLEANIVGPENTPYSNGIFHLEIFVPDNYPFCPPSIKFLTKIYHPNIDEGGRICLDLIKMPPIGNWRPTIGLEGLLIAIRMLLEQPNPEDPLMIEIAEEFKNNKSEFYRKAQLYTSQHASQ